MNAFKYSQNEEAPKEMKTPLIAIVALSNEGPESGPKSRIEQIGAVLEANDMSFDDFKNVKR